MTTVDDQRHQNCSAGAAQIGSLHTRILSEPILRGAALFAVGTKSGTKSG